MDVVKTIGCLYSQVFASSLAYYACIGHRPLLNATVATFNNTKSAILQTNRRYKQKTTTEYYPWSRIIQVERLKVPYNLIGHVAEADQFKWRVLLNSSDESLFTVCGGALVSDFTVATTATCLHNFKTKKLFTKTSIKFGGRLVHEPYFETTILLHASNIKIHPEFSFNNLQSNIALITLNEAVKATSLIKNIDIAKSLSFSSSLTVTGFGRSGSYLKYFILKPDPTYKCMSAYNPDVCNPSIFTASWVVNSTISIICSLESGAPVSHVNLFIPWKPHLVGLASFVSEHECANYPDGYVSIAAHYWWLKKNVI